MDFLHVYYTDFMSYWHHSKTRTIKRMYLKLRLHNILNLRTKTFGFFMLPHRLIILALVHPPSCHPFSIHRILDALLSLLGIRGIVVRILTKIPGSVPLTKGSGSGSNSFLRGLLGCKKIVFFHIFFFEPPHRYIIVSLKI